MFSLIDFVILGVEAGGEEENLVQSLANIVKVASSAYMGKINLNFC